MNNIIGNLVILAIGIFVVSKPKIFLRKDQKYKPNSTSEQRIKNIRYVGVAIIILGIILIGKALL